MGGFLKGASLIRTLRSCLAAVFFLHMMMVGMGHAAPVAMQEGACPHHHETAVKTPHASAGDLADLIDVMAQDKACAVKCSVVLPELQAPSVFSVSLIIPPRAPEADQPSRAPPALERPPRFL